MDELTDDQRAVRQIARDVASIRTAVTLMAWLYASLIVGAVLFWVIQAEG